MSNPADTIIGSLPDPEDIDMDDLEDMDREAGELLADGLPPTIVGSLPGLFETTAPRHEVKHTHFTPDGKIVQCRCGWESGLCRDDETLAIIWLNHL